MLHKQNVMEKKQFKATIERFLGSNFMLKKFMTEFGVQGDKDHVLKLIAICLHFPVFRNMQTETTFKGIIFKKCDSREIFFRNKHNISGLKFHPD